jgi:hypothetical protein
MLSLLAWSLYRRLAPVTVINRKYPPKYPLKEIVPWWAATGPKNIKKSKKYGFSRRLWVKTRKTVPEPIVLAKNAKKMIVNY